MENILSHCIRQTLQILLKLNVSIRKLSMFTIKKYKQKHNYGLLLFTHIDMFYTTEQLYCLLITTQQTEIKSNSIGYTKNNFYATNEFWSPEQKILLLEDGFIIGFNKHQSMLFDRL